MSDKDEAESASAAGLVQLPSHATERKAKKDHSNKKASKHDKKHGKKHKKKHKKHKRDKKDKKDKHKDTDPAQPSSIGTKSSTVSAADELPQQAKHELADLFAKSGVARPVPAPVHASSAQATTRTSAGDDQRSTAAGLVSSFKQAREKQQFSSLREKLRKQLTCAVCCDILYMPVTTPCGHAFCQACILHLAATGGNLAATAHVLPEGAPPGESQKDFKCPLCRTELPGFVADVGVSVALWETINTVFPGYAWKNRAEHQKALARARAIPIGAWASYYRHRLGAVVDGIEGERAVRGRFDGTEDGGKKFNQRLVNEQSDGRIVVQNVRANPDDSLRRHVISFLRFPRRGIQAGKSFTVAVGLLDMEEDEVEDGVPAMVAHDDESLLSNARDTITMALYKVYSAGQESTASVVEVDSDGEDVPPPYEADRVSRPPLSQVAIARSRVITAPIVEEKRDLFDGAARFENICASTPGRFRLVRAPIFVNANTAITFLSTSKQLRIATIQEFKSTPSNCSTYIDFDVVWRVSEDDGSSGDESDGVIRLEDCYSDDESGSAESGDESDSFVVSDDEISFMSDASEEASESQSTRVKVKSRRAVDKTSSASSGDDSEGDNALSVDGGRERASSKRKLSTSTNTATKVKTSEPSRGRARLSRRRIDSDSDSNGDGDGSDDNDSGS